MENQKTPFTEAELQEIKILDQEPFVEADPEKLKTLFGKYDLD